MKITKFVSFLFVSLILSTLVAAQTGSKKKDQRKFRRFWKKHPYAKYENISQEKLDFLPKYDRPDLAELHNFRMIVNPYTFTVPHQQRFKVIKYVNEYSKRLHKAAIPSTRWTERGPNNFGGRTRALMYDPTDKANGYKKVWAGGVAGGLWFNNDITKADSQWHKINDFWPNLAITTITHNPSDSNEWYVGTGEGWNNIDAVRGDGIWTTKDAGKTWNQLTSTKNNGNFTYVQKIVINQNNRIFVATNGGLFFSDNKGLSWTKKLNGFFSDIEIASNNDLYASVGKIFNQGKLYKSANGGNNWSEISIPFTVNAYRIELACAPSNPNVLYVIGANSERNIAGFFRSDNGGNSWTSLAIPKYTNDNKIHFTRNQAWYNLILGVHPNNANTVFAGGIDFHRSTNGGNTWSTISHWYGGFGLDYLHADQHAIVFHPSNSNQILFGNDGGVSLSDDASSSSPPNFYERNNGYNVTQFYSVALNPNENSSTLFGGTQDNGTHKFVALGINSTSKVSGGDGGFCFVDQQDSTYAISSYVRNSWYLSSDGGQQFQRLTFDGTGRFINPADYDDNAKILYAASSKEKLFRIRNITGAYSVDTIQILGDKTNDRQLSLLIVSPYSNNTLFVGTDLGDIYKISNAHTAPVSVNIDPQNSLPSGYISSIAIGESEDHLLVVFSNYGVKSVWETTNGGNSWVNKEGNLPDMPIRWALFNPLDSNQALLATEVGVWSTNNLSANSVDWQPTNSGLANVRCDMLKIRSSDNLVAVATHGRGIFTSNVFFPNILKPGAELSQFNLCTADSLFIKDKSEGKIQSWKWTITPNNFQFINGTNENSPSPNLMFSQTGNYKITLVISEKNTNVLDSINYNVLVESKPLAAFSYSVSLEDPSSMTIDFTSESKLADNYIWDFGNGSKSNLENPRHRFDRGNYLVSLTAINKCGENTIQDSVRHYLSIASIENGTVRILPNPARNYMNVEFKNDFQPYTLYLTDLLGKLVWQQKGQLPNERFSITQIPIGHYYIRIELQNGKVLEDILIKQ